MEFGARNGIVHSNTYVLENNLGWSGLLFEVDEREHEKLVRNRPKSDVILGPVCPSDMDNVTIILSNIPGYTGTNDTYGTVGWGTFVYYYMSKLFSDGIIYSYNSTVSLLNSIFLCWTEPTRYVQEDVREIKNFKCHHLAKELKARNMDRIDYMSIDTEGSEVEIVNDFPWDEFDIRVVQIEQLLPSAFPSQVGRKEMIITKMESFGYTLLSEFPVGGGSTTQDLIFTRNLDHYLEMTKASDLPSRIWPHEHKEGK